MPQPSLPTCTTPFHTSRPRNDSCTGTDRACVAVPPCRDSTACLSSRLGLSIADTLPHFIRYVPFTGRHGAVCTVPTKCACTGGYYHLKPITGFNETRTIHSDSNDQRYRQILQSRKRVWIHYT